MKVSSYSMKLYYAMTSSMYLSSLTGIFRLRGMINTFYFTGITFLGVAVIIFILLCRSDKRFASTKGWKELSKYMPTGSQVILYLALFSALINIAIYNIFRALFL